VQHSCVPLEEPAAQHWRMMEHSSQWTSEQTWTAETFHTILESTEQRYQKWSYWWRRVSHLQMLECWVAVISWKQSATIPSAGPTRFSAKSKWHSLELVACCVTYMLLTVTHANACCHYLLLHNIMMSRCHLFCFAKGPTKRGSPKLLHMHHAAYKITYILLTTLYFAMLLKYIYNTTGLLTQSTTVSSMLLRQ